MRLKPLHVSSCVHASEACMQAEAEEKERRRKEKLEAHLYTIIKVARELDFKAQIGDSKFFDLVDHEKVQHATAVDNTGKSKCSNLPSGTSHLLRHICYNSVQANLWARKFGWQFIFLLEIEHDP